MCLGHNNYQIDFTNYNNNALFTIAFPLTLIKNDDTFYTVTIYFGGSAVTPLAEGKSFVTDRVDFLGNAQVAYELNDSNYSNRFAHFDYTPNVSNPYNIEGCNPFYFYREYGTNSETIQLTFRGMDFYYDPSAIFAGLMFHLDESYISSYNKLIVVISLSAVVDDADYTEAMHIVKAIGDAAQKVIDGIDASIDEQTKEILAQLVGDGEIDKTAYEDAKNDIDDYSGKQKDLEDSMGIGTGKDVVVNGTTYNISMDSTTFEDLRSAYYSQLIDFEEDLPKISQIFTDFLNPFFDRFGILLYFGLMIGLLAMIFGRRTI